MLKLVQLSLGIIFTITLSLYSGSAFATDCKTGDLRKKDYCKTQLVSNIGIYTGGDFGDLSLVIWGHWMVYDNESMRKNCFIEVNGSKYKGVYKALMGTGSQILDVTKDAFLKHKGKKISKDNAPWAACHFSAPFSYSIAETFLVNSRYVYQIDGQNKETFYKEEIIPFDAITLKRKFLQHSERSFERTSFDNRGQIRKIFGLSLKERLNSFF
ncbi:hypothetical protein N9E91_07445 [Alphaproteobacteria bacterium]|nr:hypothetical protein [Alphaproteobacteria bacterium]